MSINQSNELGGMSTGSAAVLWRLTGIIIVIQQRTSVSGAVSCRAVSWHRGQGSRRITGSRTDCRRPPVHNQSFCLLSEQ